MAWMWSRSSSGTGCQAGAPPSRGCSRPRPTCWTPRAASRSPRLSRWRGRPASFSARSFQTLAGKSYAPSMIIPTTATPIVAPRPRSPARRAMRLAVDACSLLHAKQLDTDQRAGLLLIERLCSAHGLRLHTTTGVRGEQVSMSLSSIIEVWDQQEWWFAHKMPAIRVRATRNRLGKIRPLPAAGDKTPNLLRNTRSSLQRSLLAAPTSECKDTPSPGTTSQSALRQAPGVPRYDSVGCLAAACSVACCWTAGPGARHAGRGPPGRTPHPR